MIRTLLAYLSVFHALTFAVSISASADEVVKQIICNGFKTTLAYDSDSFFGGTVSVEDSRGRVVFRDEAFYSSCYFDTLTDVDGNGVKELITGLSTGASPYVWSELLVFNFSDDSLKVFSVTNGELRFAGDGNAYFSSTIRLSPAYLGALYEYPIICKGGRMLVPFGDDLIKFSKDIKFDENYYREAIQNFENEIDECMNRQDYLSLFEVYLITSVFSGRRGFAEEFMRKTYKCEDTGDAVKEAGQYADSILNEMKKDDFVYRKD